MGVIKSLPRNTIGEYLRAFGLNEFKAGCFSKTYRDGNTIRVTLTYPHLKHEKVKKAQALTMAGLMKVSTITKYGEHTQGGFIGHLGYRKFLERTYHGLSQHTINEQRKLENNPEIPR